MIKGMLPVKWERKYDEKDQRNYTVPHCGKCYALLIGENGISYLSTCPKCGTKAWYLTFVEQRDYPDDY